MMTAEFYSWFDSVVPALDAWGRFVVRTIEERVKADVGSNRYSGFFKIQPTWRVKEFDSLSEKLVRKSYDDPRNQITDMVGCRFVVLLRSDIEILDRAIINRANWSVSKDRDFHTESFSDPAVFDYQSMHYVVRNSCKRIEEGIEIPEGLPCEIQTRSLLQHAYAELVHGDIYKGRTHIPETTRRLVARSMALMESTDDIFLTIADELASIRKAQHCLFTAARQVYRDIDPGIQDVPTELFNEIADTYRDLLKEASQDGLSSLMNDARRRVLLRERAEGSELFSDPVSVLVYWLVKHHKRRTFRDWPRDDLRGCLELVAADLGMAPPP